MLKHTKESDPEFSFEKIIIQQTELEKIILQMANVYMDKDNLVKISDQLYDLYIKNNFRHLYSSLSNCRKTIEDTPDALSVDMLANNFSSLIEIVQADTELQAIFPNIVKMIDHLNLEDARISEFKKMSSDVEDLQKSLDAKAEALTAAEKKLGKANRQVKNLQTQIVTVLGIFSAIVLTFSGSLSFSSNTISNMASTPIRQGLFFIPLCGFVVFNVIVVLMYFISKIVEQDITQICKDKDGKPRNCMCKKKCWAAVRLHKKMPYVFWTNLILIIFIVGSCSAPYVVPFVESILQNFHSS